jgi:hypothetical protein
MSSEHKVTASLTTNGTISITLITLIRMNQTPLTDLLESPLSRTRCRPVCLLHHFGDGHNVV